MVVEVVEKEVLKVPMDLMVVVIMKPQLLVVVVLLVALVVIVTGEHGVVDVANQHVFAGLDVASVV